MTTQRQKRSRSFAWPSLDWAVGSQGDNDYDGAPEAEGNRPVQDEDLPLLRQPRTRNFSFSTVKWKISQRLRAPRLAKSSPFDTLPPEILQEIFYHYVYAQGKPWKEKTLRKRGNILTGSYTRIEVMVDAAWWKEPQVPLTTPMHLAHVCSRWRQITFSTSVLWSRLRVIDPRLCDIPLYKFWMERSGPALLDLFIKVDSRARLYSEDGRDLGWDYSASEVFFHVMQTLTIQAAHRWRTLSLKLGPCAVKHFKRLVKQHATVIDTPSLQMLDLDIHWWSQSEIQSIGDFFSSSPALRNLSLQLHSTVFGVRWNTFIAPWDSITELHLRSGASSTCHCEMNKMLPSLRSLEVLWVYAIGVCYKSENGHCPNFAGTRRTNRPPPALLPSLQKLHLDRLLLEPWLAMLLDNINTPKLHTLSAGLGSDGSRWTLANWAALDRLVVRSGCHIYHLAWGENSGLEFVDAAERLDLAEITPLCDDVVDHLLEASETSLRHLRTLDLRSPVRRAIVDIIATCASLYGPSELFDDLRYIKAFVRDENAKARRSKPGEILQRVPCVEWVCEDVMFYYDPSA